MIMLASGGSTEKLTAAGQARRLLRMKSGVTALIFRLTLGRETTSLAYSEKMRMRVLNMG